ncbi:TPA: hypothetical protein ACGU7T_001254 [Vibrio vulnificus]
MSSITKKMSLGERISLVVSILSFIVAFLGLTLSDGFLKLNNKADIVSVIDNIKLNTLTSQNGYIGVLNVMNIGEAASKNIKIIINFEYEVPKFEFFSDEDILDSEIKGRKLNISLERLSSDSNLKVVMYSDSPIKYGSNYIDDSGNHKIMNYTPSTQQSLMDVILVVVIIISLLVVVWIYRKASESALLEALEMHQNEIQVKLREVRDEIGNIEVVVNEPNNSTATIRDNDKGIGQRLADFMNI